MSLSFTHGNVEYSNHGSGTSLDDLTTLTIMAWVKLDTLVAGSRNIVVNKQTATDEGLTFIVGNRTSSQSQQLVRQSSATWLAVEASNANFSAYGTGKWLFAVGVMDFGNDARLLLGDLTTAPAEPSSYSTQDNGTGTITTDASNNLYVGNGRSLSSLFSFGGEIAHVHITNTALTNQQIIAQWMRPHPLAGTVLFTHYGYNGTGTQTDWSGNANNGTITGSPTVDVHVPLMTGFGRSVGLPYEVSAGGGSVSHLTLLGVG